LPKARSKSNLTFVFFSFKMPHVSLLPVAHVSLKKANWVSPNTQFQVPLNKLLKLRNGQDALEVYDNEEEEESLNRSSIESGVATRASKRTRTKTENTGFVNSATIVLDSETDESSVDQCASKKRRFGRGRSVTTTNNSRQGSKASIRRLHGAIYYDNDSDSEPLLPLKHAIRPTRGGPSSTSIRSTRSSKTSKSVLNLMNRGSTPSDNDDDDNDDHDDDDDDDDEDELAGNDLQDDNNGSDTVYNDLRPENRKKPTRGHRGVSQSNGRRGRPRKITSESEIESPERPIRRSGRVKQAIDMTERRMGNWLYGDDVAMNNVPKVISIREIYQPIEKHSPFDRFHSNECDVCSGTEENSSKGISPLIHCQGCSTSIHKVCLGYRSGREHMVTKVGPENFVMQCRRCINIAMKKDPSAPRLDICQSCKNPGPSCCAFSPKRTAKQEEKLREENDGQDPITEVSRDLLNNFENILFRCTTCHLAYHFEHLPPPSGLSKTPNDTASLREVRLKQYLSWQCKKCTTIPTKVQTLVAWRLARRDSYIDGQAAEDFREDEKEYLIKWQDKSYFQCSWMPGAWVWGVTPVIMRTAFFRRDEGANLLPKWTKEEAIPEEYLRMEIIFEVSYIKGFRRKSEKNDKAAINMVEQVLVKFQGLGYEDAVWEEPPGPEDKDRWSDFVAAYNEYIAGRYFKKLFQL